MKKLIILFLSIITLLPITVNQISYADNMDDEQHIIYNTGVILTNLGDIDSKNGHYWMDFIIFIDSEGVDFTKETPLLSFVNGRNLIFSDELIESDYYEVRVQGEFFNEFDYRLFPFHELSLRIAIEPKIPFDITRVSFNPTNSDHIDPSLKIHGWAFVGSDMNVITHAYPDGLEFSRLITDFKISHEPIGVALSTLLPVTILTGIAMFVFFIPENFTPRIYLTAPILLAVVYWHQSNLSHLPVLGYLTFFDKILLIYYALFVNAIMSLVFQMRIHVLDNNGIKIQKINQNHALFIPIIIILGILIVLIF